MSVNTIYYPHIITDEPNIQSLVDGDGDSLSNDIVLSTEDNNLVLTLKVDEYTKLLSSALYGAMLTYPSEYIAVIYPLIKAGKLEFCEQVLSCIENNTAIQETINQIANSGVTVGIDATENSTIASTALSGGQSVSCNNDNLFGMINGIVDLTNNLALDLLESLQASANASARFGDLVEAVPVIGELPFDDIAQFLEKFLDDMTDNYEANYTVALRNEYRCELFCLALDNNCELDFHDIAVYFANKLGTDLTTLDVQDIIDWLTQGLFSGTEIVHMWSGFMWALINTGVTILGIDSRKIVRIVASMWNDPDSDWNLLCPCAEPLYTYVFDYTASDCGFIPVDGAGNLAPNNAEWFNGLGWGNLQSSPTKHIVYIKKDIVDCSRLVSTEMTVTIRPTQTVYQRNEDINLTNLGIQYSPPPTGTVYTFPLETQYGQELDNIRYTWNVLSNLSSLWYQGYITTYKMTFRGVQPTNLTGGTWE